MSNKFIALVPNGARATSIIKFLLQPHPINTRPEATLLTLHQFGRYFAQILPSVYRHFTFNAAYQSELYGIAVMKRRADNTPPPFIGQWGMLKHPYAVSWLFLVYFSSYNGYSIV